MCIPLCVPKPSPSRGHAHPPHPAHKSEIKKLYAIDQFQTPKRAKSTSQICKLQNLCLHKKTATQDRERTSRCMRLIESRYQGLCFAGLRTSAMRSPVAMESGERTRGTVITLLHSRCSAQRGSRQSIAADPVHIAILKIITWQQPARMSRGCEGGARRESTGRRRGIHA